MAIPLKSEQVGHVSCKKKLKGEAHSQGAGKKNSTAMTREESSKKKKIKKNFTKPIQGDAGL